MCLTQSCAMRNDGLYFPCCLEERRECSIFCMMLHSATHSSPTLEVHNINQCLCPAFLIVFIIVSLHLNLIPRREQFPQDWLFKEVIFPEGFVREHSSQKGKGKLSFYKPKRAPKEVISLLFHNCSGQFLFWLQYCPVVPMAAKTTQASFLWFSALQELFERNYHP